MEKKKMRYRWYRFGLSAAAMPIICFLIVMAGNGQPLPQPKPQGGQEAQDKPQMAETELHELPRIRERR